VDTVDVAKFECKLPKDMAAKKRRPWSVMIMWGKEHKLRQSDAPERTRCIFAALIVAPTIFGFWACPSLAETPPNGATELTPSDKASELAAEQPRLHDIIVNKTLGRGLSELQEVIAAPAFESLAVEDQFQTLSLAAAAARPTNDALARGYLDRAIALPGIEFWDQLANLKMAVSFKYAAGTTKSLTLLAQQWPDHLASFDNHLILRALSLAEHGARGDRLLALQSLYDAHWKVKWDIEPSVYWRDLAVLLLEKGSLREAIDVSSHVKEPYIVIAMRADHRFDAIVSAHPDWFDVDAAADRRLKILQSLSDAHPDSLELKTRLMEVLRYKRHYAAMLATSDFVVQQMRATNSPERLYDDYVERLPTFIVLRSIALQRLGHWDEAVAQLVEGAKDGNVTQLINLGYLYCALNRPKEALAVISRLSSTRTSASGAMQVEAIKLHSAVQTGDNDQASRSLQFLSEHRADSPDAYLNSLIAAKQLDLAAKYLVSELQDLDLRQNALGAIQGYSPRPGSETELEREARFRSVVSRKEVQAAIHKVGRVESYQLEADW
jgi:hypothetical protein